MTAVEDPSVPAVASPTATWVRTEPVVLDADQPRAVTARTADERSTLFAALATSGALSWLLYTQLLPLSGKLGFVLVWFALFLVAYTGMTALTQPRPVVLDRLTSGVIHGGAAVVGIALVSTIVFTLVKGFPAYRHLNFFTQDMSAAGPQDPLTQGGVLHAVVGSMIQLGIAVAISLPLGVAAAVYMTEVVGRFARVVRTVVEAMTALPDLVAGLFVYAFFIISLGQSRTGLAAGLALSITMLPIIARSSEVVLRIVPDGLREASLALGATTWRTVVNVVLPTARAGLATALILGMARGVGETAPVLIVSAPSGYLNANPLSQPMNSLPLFIYSGVRAPDSNSITRGYGAASVLLVLVIVLFVVIRLLARRRGTPK